MNPSEDLPDDVRDRTGLAALSTQAVRTCQDGEPVPFDIGVVSAQPGKAVPAPGQQDFVKGVTTPGMRDVGASVNGAAPGQ